MLKLESNGNQSLSVAANEVTTFVDYALFRKLQELVWVLMSCVRRRQHGGHKKFRTRNVADNK